MTLNTVYPLWQKVLIHDPGCETIFNVKINKKLEPIYQANYLNDLHVTDSYFLAYSYKQIHAFWNTRKNKLP